MPALPSSSLRAIRGQPHERTLWLAALSRAVTHPLTLTPLKLTDSVAVYAATLNSRPVVLKCWPISGVRTRAYAALRTTRASRQWRGSRKLASLGIPAPDMLTLIRGRSPADQPVEVLIMRHVPGDTLLQHLATPTLSIRTQHRLAEALALQCFRMAAAGVFNRDHKPSNIVVRPADPVPELVVLDAVAIRPIAWGDLHAARVPLERLILEAIGVGATPRRTLIGRFVRRWVDLIHHGSDEASTSPPDPRDAAERRRTLRAARRRVWQTVHARILAHGDPTPTDNPLAPPLSSTVG